MNHFFRRNASRHSSGSPDSPAEGLKSTVRVLKHALLIVFILGLTLSGLVTVLAFHRTRNWRSASHSSEEATFIKIRRARSEAAYGKPQRLRLNEDEINSFLASGLSSSRGGHPDTGNGVRGLSVHLLEKQINIHLLASVYGRELTMDIAGILNAKAGYMRFVPMSGSIGALPIPRSILINAVDQALSSPRAEANMRLPEGTSDLYVEDGTLVVQFK